MIIWVDDIRTPPVTQEFIVWCKTSQETIDLLIRAKGMNRIPEVMSLDHDLGGDDTSRPIVLWMCENDFWPVEVRVHSANPVGVEWLQGMINRYKPVANETCDACGGLLLEDNTHATNDRGPCYGAAL